MANLLVVAPMIVRNEAENLPALFESARGLVDAWVIVDTGSTDNTIEVARSLGATVIEDPWDDDFARSRNVVLSHAEEVHPDADWFIILDGDDRVENAAGLRSELEVGDKSVYAIKVFSTTPEGGVESIFQTRAWHPSTGTRYRNPVHAAPNVDFLRGEDGNVHLSFMESGCVRHMGYTTVEGRRRNAERTLRICREKMEPTDLHRLACESRALAALERWAEATQVSMQLVLAFRESGALSTTLPYSYAARGLLLHGEVEKSLLLLAECIQMGGGSSCDVWMNVLQTAAFGLMASSVMQARGQGEASTAATAAYDVLHMLNSTGVLAEGIPPHTMEELRKYKEESTGVLVKSLGIDAGKWSTNRPTPDYAGHFPGVEGVEGDKRILIVGDYEIASQISSITNAINQRTSHYAVSCIYKSDYIGFQRSPGSVILDQDGDEGLARLRNLAAEADLVHFIRFPSNVNDIQWGDFLGPRNTLVQYMGTQLRQNADLFMEWHETTRVMGLSAWDWTMLERSWLPYHIPLMFDPAKVGEASLPASGEPIRVCHAPTRRGFKKTELFLTAIKELQAEGYLIEGVLIEGVSNEECLRIKESCHATYDQLSVGIHGMSAIESMALNHVVIGGISNWALSVHPNVPILRATEATLKEELQMLCDPKDFEATLARLDPVAWVKKMHSPQAVMDRLLPLYDLVWNGHRLLP